MKCVMIVDDDPLVRNGLKYMLQQMPDVPEEIILCESGDEAIQVLQKEGSELVITDLKMPGISGIEFIRQARICCPETKFIILSGYQSFDDAVLAIEYGVIQYLMKPVGQKELKAAITSAQRVIELERQYKLSELQNLYWKEELFQNRLEYILTNRLVKHTEIQRMIQEDSRLRQLEEAMYLCICAPKKYVDYDRAEKILTSCIEGGICQGLLFRKSDTGIVIFLRERNSVEKIYKRLLQNMETVFVLVAGNKCSGMKDIYECYRRISYLAKYRILSKECRLIWENMETHDEISEKTEVKMKKLLEKLSVVSSDETRKLSEYVISEERIRGYSLQACETFVDIINYSIINYCSEHIPQHMALIVKKYGELKSLYNYEDIHDYLEMLDRCLSEIHNLLPRDIIRDNTGMQRMDSVIDYLNKNYYRNITLRDIADMFSYNYSYFSWLFRHETGVSFTDYLAKIRMEQAKKLLLGYHKNIRWVAEKVGYENAKNFSKAFKQYEGITPQEYCSRKETGKDEQDKN